MSREGSLRAENAHRLPARLRAEAVRLYRSSGRGLKRIAGELGISQESLRRWNRQAAIDAGQLQGLTTEEREELRALRREVAGAPRGAGHPEKSHRLLRHAGRDPVNVFRFIAAERATHQVAVLTRVLRVSRSGFYAHASRPPSERTIADRELAREIAYIHAASRGTYGAPRIHAELTFTGHRLGRKRVARLMRRACLQGVPTRRRYRTTRVAKGVAPAPDRLDRRFDSAERDRVWVADITYLRTDEGFLHLAAIVDLYSRAVVGWAMAPHLRTELVADALDMAIARRRPSRGLVHHSDRGTQGGINPSSQHLDQGGAAWASGTDSELCSCIEARSRHRDGPRWLGVRTGSRSGRRSLVA